MKGKRRVHENELFFINAVSLQSERAQYQTPLELQQRTTTKGSSSADNVRRTKTSTPTNRSPDNSAVVRDYAQGVTEECFPYSNNIRWHSFETSVKTNMLGKGSPQRKRVWGVYVMTIHASDTVLHTLKRDDRRPSETKNIRVHMV